MSMGLREFGLISTTIWQSEKFLSLNQIDAQMAYIWLHTSHKTSAGALRVGPATLSDEFPLVESYERACEIFQELADAKLILWMKPYIIITSFLDHNPTKSYLHAIGALREAFALPDCVARDGLLEQIRQTAGFLKLVRWRNKSGEPHEALEMLFQLDFKRQRDTEQRAGCSSEPISNPLDTHLEPFTNSLDSVSTGIGEGSAKIENLERKKEKGECRTDERATQTEGQETKVQRNGSSQLKGPHSSTIEAAKRLGAI